MPEPYINDEDFKLYVGDVRDVLAELPAESVDCCVTSPPYWGLRDYGTGEWEGGDELVECGDCGLVRRLDQSVTHRCPECGGIQEKYVCDHLQKTGGTASSTLGHESWGNDMSDAARERSTTRSFVPYAQTCGKCGARRVDRQLGLEPTPEQFVENMVAVFREVRRLLAPHGSLWLNLGDSYAGGGGGNYGSGLNIKSHQTNPTAGRDKPGVPQGLKAKDLVGIPWMVAFALRDDGWWLRSDIIWSKSNPMPESVTDRPTKAHEYVFLLTKQPNYYWDQEAVREPFDTKWRDVWERHPKNQLVANPNSPYREQGNTTGGGVGYPEASGRNIRSVWEITTQPYPDAHFATFPEDLPRRAIMAGCPLQVCTVCGKPRERIVGRDVPSPKVAPSEIDRYGTGEAGVHRKVGGRYQKWLDENPTQTLGWTDCNHGLLNYRRGVVLDPFMGSGTVAHVARKHGRHAVGVELNPESAELIARRTRQLSLLT